MKHLIILALIVSGGYFAYVQSAKESIVVDSYQALLQKVEVEPVTLAEVKLGAEFLANRFCNDTDFQGTSGSSVSACLEKLNNFGGMCMSRVFDGAPETFNSKDQVVAKAKHYASCTGSTG